MVPEKFDINKEYGIVLEGGGAKGAYQIGVWKAFLDYGVKIKAVAGVSVGALNGALICMGDYDKAVDLWKNISYSRVMNVDAAEMDKLVKHNFKDINIQVMRKESKKVLVSGGIDVEPLRQLIYDNIDEQKIRESDIDFIMGTFDVSNLKELDISAKEAEDGYLKDYLMASSNFPLFKNIKLHGKTYLDGGVTNNVPIDFLIKRGYKNIIVIRIYGVGMEKRVKIPEDVNLIYIAPKIFLCNLLEFDKKKATRNITLGYYDAVRVLKPLTGNDYYIDSSRSEQDYLETLLSPGEEYMKQLIFIKKLGKEEKIIIEEKLNIEEELYKEEKLDGSEKLDKEEKFKPGKPDPRYNKSITRRFIEETLPQQATILKLEKNWSYEELYYALLETCAKKLQLKKYKIYTEKELCELLWERIPQYYLNDEKSNVYMDFVLAMISNFLS